MSDPAPAIGPAKVSSALAQVRVILCQTSLPANIGACARAMKTMGLSDLYLVNPKIFARTIMELRQQLKQRYDAAP